MISLPAVSAKGTRVVRDRHPRFLEGITRGSAGLALTKGEERSFDRCIGTVRYSSNFSTLIFESSERYFVIGDFACSSFRIIFRADCAEGTQPLRQERICTPGATHKVVIHHEQIFFRTDAAIYVYTPHSTSLIAGASVDMWLDHYLYVLQSDRVLVYAEELVEEVPIEIAGPGAQYQHAGGRLGRIMSKVAKDADSGQQKNALSKILVTNGTMYLAKYSVLYKVVDQQCVFAHDCMRPVSALCCNSRRVFALSNRHILSVGIGDDSVLSVFTGVEHGQLFLTDDLLVLYNRRNGTMFYDPDSLVLLHSELLDDGYVAMSVHGNCISYLSNGLVLTHTQQRLAGVSAAGRERATAVKYIGPDLFSRISADSSREPEEDFSRELQSIIDGTRQSGDGQDRTATLGSVQALDGILASFGLEELASSSEEPSGSQETVHYSGEDEWGGDMNDSEEAAAVTDFLSLISQKCRRASRLPAAAAPTDTKSLTGVSNPPTPDIPAYSEATGALIKTYFKQGISPYKLSRFFVPSHYSWFVRNFEQQPAIVPSPMADEVYKFIEARMAGAKEPKAAVKRPLQAKDKEAAPTKKRKRGGF
ncbi:hypothetical protein PAPHI01_0910 [Pancytospora philotis]|nr:hypothetical protein PAPHI01_0910 [Pancytospora philotis]